MKKPGRAWILLLVMALALSGCGGWTIRTEPPEENIRLDSNVRSIAVSRNGKWIATGHDTGSVRIWENGTLRPLLYLPAHLFRVDHLALAGGDRFLLSSSNFESGIHAWDLSTGQRVCTFRLDIDHGGPILPDEGTKTLIAATSRGIGGWPLPPKHGWPVYRESDATWSLPMKGVLTSMAISPCGRWLAVGTAEGDVVLLKSGGSCHPDRAWMPFGRDKAFEMGNWVTCMEFTPDGRRLVSGSRTGILKVYDLRKASLHAERTFRTEYPDGTWTLAVGPDGKSVFVPEDTVVRQWSLETGDPIGGPISVPETSFNQVALRGKAIYVGGSGVRIVDIPSRAVVAAREARCNPISTLSMEPKGGFLVSAGASGVIDIWYGPFLRSLVPIG